MQSDAKHALISVEKASRLLRKHYFVYILRAVANVARKSANVRAQAASIVAYTLKRRTELNQTPVVALYMGTDSRQ